MCSHCKCVSTWRATWCQSCQGFIVCIAGNCRIRLFWRLTFIVILHPKHWWLSDTLLVYSSLYCRLLLTKGQIWWSYTNRLQVRKKISNLVLVTILLLQSQWVSAKTLCLLHMRVWQETLTPANAFLTNWRGSQNPALETTLRFPVQQSALIPTNNEAGLSQNPVPSRPEVFHLPQDMASRSTGCPRCTALPGALTLAHTGRFLWP